MKLDISVTDGWTRLEYRSFDAYNEATKLQEMIENLHKREGHYPSRYWQIRYTGTGRISATAKRGGSGCPDQLWEGPKRERIGTRLRITGTSANGSR